MLLFNRYEYNPQTDLIGKGGFSRVYKALDKKFNRYLALKIYKTSELSERYSPIAEINRVIELDHPNISRYIDIEEIENTDSFGQIEKIQVCVMELLEGGNLAVHFNMYKDLDVFKKLLVDVLKGLSYLHRNGIIHRDIKPANILIKQNIDGPLAKITDFGISKKSDSTADSSSSALIVSIPYMAPEQLNVQKYGIGENIHYNIDLWSLGVAVYEIISGEVLFKNNPQDSSEQIMTNIISSELPAKIKFLPYPFDEFVSKCVIKDAKERVKSADELLKLLEPFQLKSQITQTPLNQSKNPPANDENTGSLSQELKLKIPQESFKTEILSRPNKDDDFQSSDDTTILSFKSGESLSMSQKFVDTPADDNTRIINSPERNAINDQPDIVINTDEQSDDHTQVIQTENENIETKIFQTDLLRNEEIDQNINSENSNKDVDFPSHQNDTNIIETDSKLISENAPIEIPPTQSFLKQTSQENVEEITINRLDRTQDENKTVIFEKPINENEHPKVTLFNRYDYYPGKDMIGKGGFSRVYKAYDQKLSRWVALKIYKTSEFSDRYSPIAEIKRVVNLDHSNICRYLDIEEIEKINPFGEVEKIQVCVMELMDSGNFLEYFNNAGKDLYMLKKLLTDVLQGISYLHKNGIIHRDIKPANILIKQTIEGPVAKITDFGISKVSDSINNNSSSALIVSIPYMAPEQLNTKKYGIDEKISFNLDIWSLGVTIYEVIIGKALFKNSDQESSEQIMANIMDPELPKKIDDLPHPFRNIVAACVVKNAKDRAQKAEELLVLLKAPEAKPPPMSVTKISEPITIPNAEKILELPKTPELIQTTIKEPEQVVKKKFVIDEGNSQKEKIVNKQFGMLKLFISIAAILLIVATLLYLNMDDSPTKVNPEPKKVNAVTGNSATTMDSNSNAESKIPPVVTTTSAKKVTPPKEINTDRVLKNNIATSKEKPKVERIENASLKNENLPLKNSSSEKYLLTVHAETACDIMKNGVRMGPSKPGKPIQLPLAPGKYTISAISNEGETVNHQVEVSVLQSGKKGSLQIKF